MGATDHGSNRDEIPSGLQARHHFRGIVAKCLARQNDRPGLGRAIQSECRGAWCASTSLVCNGLVSALGRSCPPSPCKRPFEKRQADSNRTSIKIKGCRVFLRREKGRFLARRGCPVRPSPFPWLKRTKGPSPVRSTMGLGSGSQNTVTHEWSRLLRPPGTVSLNRPSAARDRPWNGVRPCQGIVGTTLATESAAGLAGWTA